MRQTLKRSISFLLAFVMVTGLFATMSFTTFAAGVDYNHNASTSTDEYYNLISKQDWDNAPGISESEIVLNNDAGSYRQVIHIMKADINNEYVDVIPTYAEMDTSKYQTAIMMDQANWIDENMEGEVIGVMNCCLSWYSGYDADRVGEPLGFMMMDGEIMFDPGNCGYNYGAVGFPTCVVINKDFNDAGEARPADIPKLEMVQIRTSADLDGWEDTVIPISSGYIVKDGVNQSKPNHSGPAPRSVVGITADGQVVIMENDGRQEPFSAGMNMYECAEVMLAAGCVWAANCDGGGSSTFISQRPGEELKVNNSVSDGVERASTSGICFISTAPATGEFVRATITTDDEYYTPKSSVKFNAVGTDLVGTLVDIPAEAYWQVTDGMGSIDENGLFVSNGTTGVATAELVYEGKVVGSASINVVIPEEIAFNQNVITLPNGETTKLVINAQYGVHSVVTKLEDFDIVLSDGAVGTLNGFEFTATSDTAITGGSITVTLVHDTSKVAGATLRFGRASEVLFDFEDASSFADIWKTTDWKNAGVINNSGGYYAKYGVYAVNKMNGKVHDGNGAMAMVNDFSYGNSSSWNSFYVNYYGEPIKIENAQAIGCWVYVPNDTPYVEFYLRVTNDSGKNVGKNLIYGDPDTPAKTGWQYISFDISQYKYITFNPGDKFIQVYYGGIQGVGSLVDDPELNYKSTYYIDTVTVDYSTAVADREAPVFSAPQIIDSLSMVSEVNGQTVTSSVNTFEVAVADFVKDNAVGINAATAKAYIDGNSMSCKYANGKIVLADVSMADGTHTITFTIEDSNGNLAEISRKIKIAANSNTPTASVVPHDATLDRILIGSLYYLDVNVTNVELTDKVELTINLNNLSQWELDHMTVAKGFEATYVIDATDPMDQIATITITRVGESDIVGAGTVASLPVRTWEWKQDEAPTVNGKYYTPEDAWEDSFTYYTIVKAYDIEGTLTLTDSTKVPFGADDIQVDTELWGNSSSGLPNTEIFNGKDGIHVHTAVPMDDVAATCTEAGYTGRTFCEVCNSVVDWGTTVPVADHKYEAVDGKLTCVVGGELFNGVYTDGKFYVDGVVVADGWFNDVYYVVDGKFVTGQYLIDGNLYTFDENGVYMPDYLYTGFYYDGTGWTYYMGNFQKKGFVVISGDTYYFDDRTGYAPVGSFTLAGDRVYKVEGEQGKVLGAWDTVVDNGVEYRRYYYSLRYYKNEWHEVDGEQYFFNNEGYALAGGTYAVAAKGEYLGGYRFAEDGRMIEAITGPFVDKDSGWMFFAENGELARNELVKYGNDYYFARNNYLLITWSTYISEEQSNGLLPAGEYQFGADGKLIMLNGPIADPYNPAYLNFYKDGIRIYEEGLYEFEGDYYYVRGNGLLLTWGMNITKTNGLLPAGEYKFGEDGKLQMLNGPIADAYNSAYLNFYKDGIRVYEEGLYEFEGNYYYVRSNGLLLTWGMNITKTNGLLPAGEYKFGEDGKLQMLNGPVEDAYNSAYLNFYKDGIRIYEEGLYEFEGNYYYVRGNGLLLTWGMNITKTNGLLPAGEYKFGEDGKLQMLNGPVEDAYNSAYLNFYKDGIRIYEEGLYEFEGDYYYVRSNGLLITWGTYVSEEKANGLLPAGEYQFGADGKMI